MLATKRDLVEKKNYQLYLITNTRGDVIEMRDGNGNVRGRNIYDSWGKVVAVVDQNGNALGSDTFQYQISLKYRGYIYDHETGLYYLQSRYYDPETGRFINADSVDYIGVTGTDLSYNLFAYCENDPVDGYDPSGTISFSDIKKAFAGIFKFMVSLGRELYNILCYFVKNLLNTVSYKKGIIWISSSLIATLIDIVLYNFFKTETAIIKVISKFTEKLSFIASDWLMKFFQKKIVPYIVNGYVNTFLTKARNVLWTLISKVTGFTIDFVTGTYIDSYIEYVDIRFRNLHRNTYISNILESFNINDIVTMFSSLGNVAATILDVMDGSHDKGIWIKVKRRAKK